ncbi:MAG: hypothetical protein MI919_08125 [Holophagales bacterium]|nr:hypothetical protein [Holophagales bacterium]
MRISDTLPIGPAHGLTAGLIVAVLLTAGSGPIAAAEPTQLGSQLTSAEAGASRTAPLSRWLGADGQPLPFADAAEVLEFLSTAEMVGKRELSNGTTRPWKVTLQKDGVRAHAIFRHIDVKKDRNRLDQFRDSYIFEVAAYEVDRLLGLGHVPPAVLRQLDGHSGSLQLWVENARSETERIEAEMRPTHPSRLVYQKHLMRVFDNLISNFDRNTGNMLVDGEGKLWFVDHTRSFQRLPTLLDDRPVVLCGRKMWQRLLELDEAVLTERLDAYLDSVQIDAVEKRRRQLVKVLSERIAEVGEDGVLFELDAI